MADQIVSPRVVVAGALHADLVLRVEHLPVPGQTVAARGRHGVSGGKGLNQAVAACGAGAEVALIGCIGGDAAGISLMATLVEHSIDCTGIRVAPAVESGMAAVLVDEKGANSIVIVAGANQRLCAEDLLAVAIGPHDVVVGQGEISLDVTEEFLVAGRTAGARTILNLAPFRPPSARLLEATTVLVVNDAELLDLAAWCTGDAAGVAGLDGPGVVEAVSGMLAAGPEALVLTLGSAGAVLVTEGGIVAVPGHRVPVTDTTGAGDAFTGVLAAELARGTELATAVVKANDAASLVVQRDGTADAMPTRTEIDAVS
ncbi:MAG TPA: ribokinase [Acidimicrobiales bacterium]